MLGILWGVEAMLIIFPKAGLQHLMKAIVMLLRKTAS